MGAQMAGEMAGRKAAALGAGMVAVTVWAAGMGAAGETGAAAAMEEVAAPSRSEWLSRYRRPAERPIARH